MTIDEDSNKNLSENRKFCFCTQLLLQYNRSVKLVHYFTCFFNTGVQFVVLSTIIRERDSKILKLLRLLQCYHICLEKKLYRVPRQTYNPSFSPIDFYSSIQATVFALFKPSLLAGQSKTNLEINNFVWLYGRLTH